MNIREISFRGLRWSIIEKAFLTIAGFVQLLVVVRYVEKEELGLMAMVYTILSFGGVFSDLGLGNSIIHKQESGHDKLSSLFWSYILIGCLLTVIFATTAPLFAYFFNEGELKSIVIIASFTFLINGFVQLYQAILYKEMKFRILSKIQITVTAISFIVVESFAMLGFGVYALVTGLLARTVTNAVCLIIIGRKHFTPGLHFSILEVREHLRFGLFQTGERIINTLNTQFDTLIIGKFLGAETLGVYDVLKRLLSRPMQLINSIVTKVSLPVLARTQEDSKKLGSLYIRQILYLCSINFPIYVFIALSSRTFIPYLLTENWLNPGNNFLFILFCLYYMIYTVQNPIGTLIIAKGQVHRSFYYNLVVLFFFPLLLTWGATKGIIVVLNCMIVFHGIMIIVAHEVLLKRAAFVPLADFTYAMLLPLVLSILAFGTGKCISCLLPVNMLFETIFTLFLGVASYFVISWKWNKAFIEELLNLYSFKLN